jgi:hypothetical protein
MKSLTIALPGAVLPARFRRMSDTEQAFHLGSNRLRGVFCVERWLRTLRAIVPLLAALLLASCATSRKPAEQLTDTHVAQSPASPSKGLPLYQQELQGADVADIHVGDSADATAHIYVQPAQKPGLLSGIGRVFSTPKGTARRQARKDAAATVPKKLGKGAVYAPAAKEVLYAWKPDAPVVQADSNATVYAASSTKGPAVAGHDNTVTVLAPLTLWQKVKAALGIGGMVGGVGLVLLLAVGWKYRRRLPVVGPFFA